MFIVSPFALYFTGLYRLTMRPPGARADPRHFIVVGCLFFWPLLGLDPLPGRWPYPARALLMFLSTPFHTVLGLTIMQSKTLLGGDWYPSLGLTWAEPGADQVVAGGILWAGGEIVSVTMLGGTGRAVDQAVGSGGQTGRPALDRAEADEPRQAATAAEATREKRERGNGGVIR